MAQLIKLKRTSVQGKIPNTTNLELGELAINTYDGRLFFEKDDGSPSIQEILTTNTTNSGSFNLIGAISASGFITASYFYGDGSNLTNVLASSIAFSDITGKPSLVSGSSQIDVTQTVLYSSLATTGSNTFKKGQIILNDTSGQNNSLTVGGNSTGDRFIVTTDTTAGNGIIISSKNNTQNSNAPLSFSGSSFEFGGGDVTFLDNVTIDGTLTINSAADVLIEENTLKLNYGTSFDSGGLEVAGTNGTGSLLWDDATSRWIAGTLGSEVPILLNSSQVTLSGVTGFTAFSSSVDTRLDALETDTGSQDNRIDSLESFSSSLSTTENTYSGSFSGSFVGDGSSLIFNGTDIVSGSSQLSGSTLDAITLNGPIFGSGSDSPYFTEVRYNN